MTKTQKTPKNPKNPLIFGFFCIFPLINGKLTEINEKRQKNPKINGFLEFFGVFWVLVILIAYVIR